MKNRNPAMVAEKWVARLSASTKDIQDGVTATQKNPMQEALRRADAYVDGVRQAVADGRWQAGLQRVSLDDWKGAMIKKGIPIIAARAALAKNKYLKFITAFLQFQQGVAQELSSMPRGSLEQNIARAVHVMRRNHEFKTNGMRNFAGQ